MCAVTHSHRDKPYQLAILIKKSLDDVICTQQSACEATQSTDYKYNINFSLSMLYLQKGLLIHLKKGVFTRRPLNTKLFPVAHPRGAEIKLVKHICHFVDGSGGGYSNF